MSAAYVCAGVVFLSWSALLYCIGGYVEIQLRKRDEREWQSRITQESPPDTLWGACRVCGTDTKYRSAYNVEEYACGSCAA